MIAPYDTTELPATIGEVVTVMTRDDESGWISVRAASGCEGWIPHDTVEELP